MTDSKNTTDTGETLPGVDVSDWPETADVTHDVPDWLIPSRVYDVLKWLALIVLPAIGVLVQTLGPVWGWTWADPVATTINAVALTIGVVIGASTLKAKASKAE